jgi:hypothetical protein
MNELFGLYASEHQLMEEESLSIITYQLSNTGNVLFALENVMDVISQNSDCLHYSPE